MSLARIRNAAVLVFGALLAVSLTISPANAGTNVSNGSAGVSASGMAVADGTVTGSDGTAMPGTPIDLYAWPSDAVLKAMKPGTLVPTRLLATATTGSTGKFMLRVPGAKLVAAAVESGYANLEIVSPVAGIWFMSHPTGSLSTKAQAPATVNFSAQKAPACGINPDRQPYNFKNFVKQHDRKPAWAVVGQGYIVQDKKTAGDTMQFQYNKTSTQNQTTSLGVGVSGLGINVGYTGSGSNTSTADGSQNYHTATSNTWFRTQFTTGQFRGECIGPENDSNIPHQKQSGACPKKITNKQHAVFYVHKCIWMIKSTGWNSGSSSTHPTSVPTANHCAPEEAGGGFKTAKEKAVQWSGGFQLGASLGIKGTKANASFSSSSQTGYDTNAVISFAFKHAGWLCGSNNKPPKAALLVVRSSKP